MATVQLTPSSMDAQEYVLSTGNYPAVTIIASGLGDGEQVLVGILGTDGVPVSFYIDATPVTLTASNSAITLTGGPDYVIGKSSSASPSFVSFSPVTHPN